MYKDFKKTESLDTGFVGGSSLLWMFSGIVLGLLVGLGMYFFSNDKMPQISMLDSLEKKIQKVQTSSKSNQVNTQTSTPNKSHSQNQPLSTTLDKRTEQKEERKNKFSYYAVLPTLDVPVGSAKPINTSLQASTIAQTTPAKANDEVSIADTTSVEEIKLVEPAEIEKLGDYLLQVASFKKQSMANKTRGRLSNKGIEAYVQKKKIKGRYWYRVVAGPVDESSVSNWKQTAEKLGHKPLVISVR